MNPKKPLPIFHHHDIKPGQIVGTVVENCNLVILNYQGEINVFEGNCPHQGALLSEGFLEKGAIVCSSHRWKFDCESGQKQGPGEACLKKFRSDIIDGMICIDKEEFSAWTAAKRQGNKPDDIPELRQFKDLPGPKSFPIIGNLLEIFSDMNNLHKTLHRWACKYGTMYKLHGFMHNRSLVVSDPHIAREILLNRPHAFSRIKSMGSAMEEIGLNGLITAEGELWKRYRKFSTHGLANKVLREYYQTIERSTTRLFNLINRASEREEVMEIQKDLLRYTVDVTSSLAFGADINTLENSDDNIQHHLAIVLPMVQRRMMIPVPYWRYFKLPIDYRLEKSLKIIKRTVNGFIKDAKDRIDENPVLKSTPANLLQALLAAEDDEGKHLTDEEVSSNVFSILLAGEDSTANSIAWALHFMTMFPDVQEKMQNEVDSIYVGDSVLGSFDSLQQLPYIEAVIYETLRLRPVLPIVQLCANEDIVIKNIKVPKGTNIQLPIYNMFLDDEFFQNSEAFNPHRWLTSDVTAKNNMQNAFLPFGYGPRVCPGRSLALLENKVVLSMICRHFTITKAKNTKPVTEIFAGLIQPENLFVTLSKRAKKVNSIRGENREGVCPFGYK
jgi:cytochrome P450/nitrite reductase/ring-hydroxylating ferredoxin subunit